MEKKNLTCIGCPMGCQITVEFEGEEVFSVTGNTCAIGDKYARGDIVIENVCGTGVDVVATKNVSL